MSTALTDTALKPSLLKGPPYDLPCVVGGKTLDSSERLAVHYPYTGEQIGSVPLLTSEQVREALNGAANSHFELSRHERAQILFAAADKLLDERDAISQLITYESGLCLKDTRYEVLRACDVFRFAGMEALRDDGRVFACDTSANGRNRRAYTVQVPVKLVAAITPFNHPLNQVAHKVAPAIAAGAPMVLKPSEKTPLSALYLAGLLSDVGLPPNLFNVVTGDPAEIAPVMLCHPDVEVVSFTGGVEIGKSIAEQLGYRRAILELGGNDPLIVLSDADLDEAAALAVSGAFKNSGQRCTAVKRILAVESVADGLVKRIVERTEKLKWGDPLDEKNDMGTVIDDRAAQRFVGLTEAAVTGGAKLLYGGGRSGASMEPTVLDFVPRESELVVKETFGPVAPVVRVKDLDDAIAVANSTKYGLSSGIVTNDLQAINRCIQELKVGSVNIREVPGYRTELTPFGGIRDSGLGIKEGVIEAIKGMSYTKLYTLPWE